MASETASGGQSFEHCANCGDVIGKLETPQVWRDNVVCLRCYRKLAAAPAARPAADIYGNVYGGPPSDVVKTTDQVVGRVLLILVAIIVFIVGISALLAKLSGM